MTDKNLGFALFVLKGSLAAGGTKRTRFDPGAYAGGHGFRNDPTNKAAVTLGNVPKQVHTPMRARTNYGVRLL